MNPLNARCVLPLAVVVSAAVTCSAQTTRKVLVIGIDGMRPDAMEIADAPAMHALAATGCYSNQAQAEDLTFSGPNWSSILHGVHRDVHHVTTNDYTGNDLAHHPDFFTFLEQHRPSLNTARFITWDAIHLYQPTGADIEFFADYASGGDAIATASAAQYLRGTHPTYHTDPDVVFVYIADVDVAGHTYGFHPSRQGYLNAIHVADTEVDQLVSAVRARPTYASEDWMIVITSDHGGAIDGSHAGNTPEKRTVPFIVNGPSVVPGTPYPQPKNVDVSRTVLTFMGATLNPAWALDGHTVGLTATAPRQPDFNINLVFNGDAEYDRGFSETQFDQYVSGWNDPGPDQTTVVKYDAPGGWPLATDPGSPTRGNQFFSGGLSATNHMSQTIDVGPLAGPIDARWVTARLSVYLGGYANQEDRAWMTVRCLDASGVTLASTLLGPVTAIQRNNQTGMILRQATANVPIGTRSLSVELDSQRFAGSSCDGYADDLSVIFLSSCVPDFDRSGRVDSQDFFGFLTEFFAGGLRADMDHSGTVNSQDFFAFLAAFFAGCT